jgi:hypothetical protein
MTRPRKPPNMTEKLASAMTRCRQPKSDLSGERFGRLVVVAIDSHKPRRWACICDCGNRTVVDNGNIRSGHTKSCGCLARDSRTTHAQSYTSEYKTWKNIKSRCYFQKGPNFKVYGGRGIRVCDRWLYGEDGKTGFGCFISDMGPRPSREHSIERLDVNGNYEPSNCEWATKKKQCRNTRANRIVYYKGKRQTLAEAVETSGLKYNTVIHRLLKGWSIDDALQVKLRGRPS